MKTRILLPSVLALSGVFFTGCMTAPAVPGPGGNANSNSSPGNSNSGGSGGSGKFTLSAEVVNQQGPSTGPDVRIFAADQAFGRLDAPYGGPLQVFTLRGSDVVGFTQQDIQIDAGMVVTMIALESRGGTTLIFEGQDESGLSSIDNAEFVSFTPDSMAGISNPERGVISFTMDRDIRVVANYRQMPSLRVTHMGSDTIVFGIYDLLEVETPQWLALPEQLPDGTFDLPAGLNLGSSQGATIFGRIFLAQAQTGSEIRITAGDLAGSGFTFGMWSATSGNCGGNRMCTLVLGQDTDVTATWNPQ